MRTTGEAAGSRRADIQGLRAIAVAAVVAYHAGLPVPGGFVGVDVFFVISGYVIAAMLRREWEGTGRVRLGRFYLRRFRRLTPALALVIGVVLLASFLLESPFNSQPRTAHTGLGALLLAANAVISQTTGSYFDAPAGTNPLLHTWSLSVEEQFYLLFPVLLVMAWRWAARTGRTWLPQLGVGLVFAVSAALMMVGVQFPSITHFAALLGFYSPVTRAWEFAVGAMLAVRLPAVSRRSPWTDAMWAIGAVMLVASLWAIDHTVVFPGPWTLLPVAGTALLIVAGRSDTALTRRVLGNRTMVFFGDRSYSIYLWHWPCIVFARMLWPDSPWTAPAAAVFSLAPALASFTYVEQPFRRLEIGTRKRAVQLVAAVMVTPAVLALALPVWAGHWTSKLQTGALHAQYVGVASPTGAEIPEQIGAYPCTDEEMRALAPHYSGFVYCGQSKPGSRVTVAIIGDSHAGRMYHGLAQALPSENVAYYMQWSSIADPNEPLSRMVQYVGATASIRTVIVAASWSNYAPPVGLARALRTLSADGRRVLVTDDVPRFPFPSIECKFDPPLFLGPRCSMGRATFDRIADQYMPALEAEVASVPGVRLLRTARFFCNEAQCSMTDGSRLLYMDTNHLNNDGSVYLAHRMLRAYPDAVAAG